MTSISNFIVFAPMWLSAVAWHLWRIMLMRPAFKNIGDTALPAVSFACVFLMAGLARYVVFGNEGVLGVTFERLMLGVLIGLAVERRHRSSALTVAFLGATVVVDIFAISLHLAGALKSTELPFLAGTLWQLALMGAAYAQFAKEPAEVQARGYRPGQVSTNPRG